MANTAKTKPFKVLCIHGYRQDEESFREKTGAFRKAFKKYCEFVFISAPHFVPSPEGDEVTGGRGWWFSDDDNQYSALKVTECDKGFQESLQSVKDIFDAQGPFDGILAFSQGAAFGLLLSIIMEQKLHDWNHTVKFSILVAPFFSRSSPHKDLLSHRISTPTLIVYGRADEVIPSNVTEEVLSMFDAKSVIVHERGHFIPVSSAIKQDYIQFFDSIRNLSG